MSELKAQLSATKGQSSPLRALLSAIAAFSAMILLIMAFAEGLRRVAARMDLGNWLNNSKSDSLTLAAIALAPFVILVIFQPLVRFYRKTPPQLLQKGIALIGAAFLSYLLGMLVLPAAAQSTLALSVGGGLLLAVLFDLFTDDAATSFGWAISALLCVNLFAASTLFLHFSQKNDTLRAAYAEALATPRDSTLAEPALADFYAAIQGDRQLPILLKAWPIKPSADSVRNYLSKLSFNQPYLFQYYGLSIYAFDRTETTPLLLDQAEDRATVEGMWNQALPMPNQTALRHDYATTGAHRYWVRVSIARMNDPNHPVELYCTFEEKYPQNTQIFSHLYTPQAFKGLAQLSQYDYAVVRENKVVVEQGSVTAEALGTQVTPGTTIRLTPAGRHASVAAAEDGKTKAVVSQPANGLLRWLYIFTVLFTLSTTLFIVSGFLSGLLPATTLMPSFKGSLSKRIQYAILGVLGLGFVVIGIFTYRHFSASAVERTKKDVLENTQAIATHLKQASARLTADSVGQALGQRMSQFARSLNVDANLYRADGKTLASTRNDLLNIGVLPTQMNGTAHQLLQKGAQTAEAEEQVDNQQFTTKYLPINNASQQTIAYVGVPYRSDMRTTNQEISDFIGILASVFAFLLLLAAGITYMISRTITRPINNIADRIKEVQLVDKNQPLQYEGDASDEIGSLVAEYNRMVDKLEDSKVKLVKLERESAWRDMARQIAHDIKNPLTTMKLSMQQLERVSNDPNQAAAYLKRATGRLIEQIDSLAQTASEFSMFASLDRTPRSPVEINHLVESVFDLFTEQRDVELSLDLPKDKHTVMADKNHLLRVLNNLVINAIQAIPSDRQGKVNVSLLRRGDSAVIRIADNGGGIPQEIRTRVFEPNFTTKTSGSGLGLAICKKIVEAHGGDIRFETQDNEGTEFFLELPIVQPE